MSQKWKIVLIAALLIPCWVVAYRFEIDFVVLHNAARLSHSNPIQVYGQNGNLGRYFYGPVSLVLAYPLGLIDFPIAKFLWTILQTLSYFVFLLFMARLFGWLKEPGHAFFWLIVFIAGINPIHNNFQSNNIQLMIAALLVLSEWLTRCSKGWQRMAGSIVAVLAFVKIFPAFVALYYLLCRPKAVKQGLFLGALFSILSPTLFFGWQSSWDLWSGFFSNVLTYESDNSLTLVPDILCLPSLLSRWMSGSPYLRIVTFSCIGVISLLFYGQAWRSKRRETTPELALANWSLALALMTLFNPSTRPHYFIFYLPALALLLDKSLLPGKLSTFTAMLAVVLIAFTAEGVVGKHWNNLLEAWSLPTYGMILLCLGMAVALSRRIVRV